MADGIFPGLVSATRDANAAANPIFTQLSDGSAVVGVTSGALDVNIDNASIVVTATDLDIRDLVNTQDSVEIWANTAKDGSGTAYVPLVDVDGKLIISNPGGTEYTEDVVAPAAASGGAILAKRDDALAGVTPAEGDWVSLLSNANGALWVKHDGDITISDGGNTITIDGTVAATQSGAWTVAATQSGVWDIGTVTTLTSITNDVNIADGGNSITVDAVDLDIRDLTHVSDSVQVGDGTTTADVLDGTIDALYTAITDGTNVVAVNANGSINVAFTEAAITGEVHDYDTGAAIASDTTDNHDYTVTGTTFLLKSVIVSGSGNIKFEVQTGPVAGLTTVAVGFLTGRQGDTKQVFFDPAVEVPVTSTGTVRVIRTNRQGAATDVYSTIIGIDQ